MRSLITDEVPVPSELQASTVRAGAVVIQQGICPTYSRRGAWIHDKTTSLSTMNEMVGLEDVFAIAVRIEDANTKLARLMIAVLIRGP